MKLGLCCLFKHSKLKYRTIHYNKFKTLTNKEKLDKVNEIYLHNSVVLLDYVKRCSDLNLHYRITSNLFPIFTFNLKYLRDYFSIKNNIELTKLISIKNNTKLSLHPDQFCVLNSPNKEVVNNSLYILKYHNYIAKLLGIDTINHHVGGCYNNKKESIKRFITNFRLLDTNIQNKLVIENDDKSFNMEDVLYISNVLNIPVTYDVHHHRCNNDSLSIEEATDLCIKTWNNRVPHFHVSSPKNGWDKPRPHHDYIDIKDFPEYWKSKNIIIDVEAKSKEEAILKLKEELCLE